MTLRDEVEEILANAMEANFVWRSLMIGDDPDTTIKLSGSLADNLQAVTTAFNAYCDALLQMVLRVADAVDDLGYGGDVEQQGTPLT
jgi:hypothetical protein